MAKEGGKRMLRDVDIYGLVELLGQASGLDSPLAAKKEFLLDGLCALIGAEAWSWSCAPRAGSRAKMKSANGGCPALLAGASRVRCGKRMITFCEMSDGAASTVLFLRSASRPPFTEEERLLARIVCEEIPWLHEPPAQLPTPAKARHLSPRQRETLQHLMTGLSYREVSQRMGISPNTVLGYVKDLYRHYGQHSRASLITRLTDTHRTV
jgi:DNA-binding CsgD family transcriptional regulator